MPAEHTSVRVDTAHMQTTQIQQLPLGRHCCESDFLSPLDCLSV